MYYQKFIEFLKKHNIYNEEVINYWTNNRMIFDYRDEEKRDLIGTYYQYNSNNTLQKIQLIVPWIDNDKTVLVNIHEYVHLLLFYPYLNKKCILGQDIEVLPIYFERVYIEENPTKELLDYYEYLNKSIKNTNVIEYTLALEASEILLRNPHNTNIKKLDKESRKIVKKLEKKKSSYI